jgi:anhydro-N-acetylmuramic acid kinase
MHRKWRMSKLMRALGLMSGTSLDGIDVALIETDGDAEVRRGPAMTFPYLPETRAVLAQALGDARGLKARDERPGVLAEAEREVTERHAAAVREFIRLQGLDPAAIGVVGFHGQTVLHRPEERLTVQLGLGDTLSELVRLPVVYDLRAADVAAGGQGAPLAPVYHRALAAQIAERPLAVLNIGGVANVTWIGRDGHLVAFDTGPGNALIDDWMERKTGQPRDDGGAMAAKGKVDDDVLRAWLSHPFFPAPPPKSLDRNAFVRDVVKGMGVEDGAATLTAFTAAAIGRAREHFPEEPSLWIACGGGRKNRTLMGMIAERVENALIPAEMAGFDGDSIEAEAWAYLAVRSLRGLPITFPGTTGVPQPLAGGVLSSRGCPGRGLPV